MERQTVWREAVWVMEASDVRQRPGPAQYAAGPRFDLIASKLHPPPLRPGTVCRAVLIQRLAREDSPPIVSVVAPAGYGKTTLLAQWAERSGQAVAWVSLDEKDNDPKVLLSYVAGALDAVQSMDGRVFEALASPVSSVPGSVVPRLGAAFMQMTTPVVLVLDDVHALHNRVCRSALSVLADHVPPGSRLVLAGRAEPPLRVARLRAEGRLLEIGPGDLSLNLDDAAVLLSGAGLALDDDAVAALHRRTEGWPVGLYLAALYLREGGSVGTAGGSFGGDDWLVSEYVKSEILAQIPRRERTFLTRTAVLERMSGPLCEAVLDLPGSAAILADLARSNLLMVPLGRRGQWYRYHHLFREMLMAELQLSEPGLVPVLRRRAAAWCARNNLPEEALEYFISAGDAGEVARLVASLWLPTYWQGRVATLQRWLGWLEDQGGIDHPMVAVQASLLSAAMGRPAEAERWADLADRYHNGLTRPGNPSVQAWTAVLRAILCRHGPRQMRSDADEAVQRFAALEVMTPSPVFYQGVAQVLSGDLDGADAAFVTAVLVGEQANAHEIRAGALAERSLLALARHHWEQAKDLAGQARTSLRRAGLDSSYVAPLVYAAQARAALHHGDVPAAHQELINAQRVRPLLTYALPHFAVQSRIELTRAHLALNDMAGAKTLMRETDEILQCRPDLGILVGEAQALRTRLSAERTPTIRGASSLTAAELRVLPMLATHLSFPELGAEMFLSPNTVKSQAMSIYRKLGVSSRSQAVIRSRELGLLEGLFEPCARA
jgi:LuxR family transcriptional regulator, maltose regulon positive regulatory protein